MASWMSCSVCVSMELVASSSTKMRGSASTARAKDTSCFSPVESLSPPSPTSVSQPFSSFAATRSADTAFAAASTSSSVASSLPYLMFSRSEPENRCGLCST